MTEEKYFIRVSMKVQSAFIEIARFSLGANEIYVIDLFHELEGDFVDVAHYPLRIELIKEHAMRYTMIACLGCSLTEFLNNSKKIIKETFRIMNLSV
ncbi:hypothetical protein [Deminuibacter soli]|nr:hypothetical protein [Deminuibacter soli]